MPPKKPKESSDSSSPSLHDFLSSKFKDNTFSTPSTLLPLTRLPSGIPSIDYLLGGGLPLGRSVQLFGHPSCGKSSISLFISSYLLRHSLTPAVLYIDVERTLLPSYISKMGLVPPVSDNFICCSPMYGEDALTMAVEAATHTKFVILDSIAELLPRSVLEKLKDDPDYKAPIGTLANLIKTYCQSLRESFYFNQSCFFILNQVRDNIEYKGVHSPGGNSLRHLLAVNLHVLNSNTTAKEDGKLSITIKSDKNNTFTAGLSSELLLENGVPNVYQSLINECRRFGLITLTGSWYNFSPETSQTLGLESTKLGQGIENSSSILKENPSLFSSLYSHFLSSCF